MIIIFIGAPGSGKGTVSSFMEKENWVQISTGNIFREILKEDNKFSLEIKSILSSGKLISDDITSNLLEKKLRPYIKANRDIILDGYPRTENQVRDLDVILDKLNTKIDKVINFNILEKNLIDRLIKRRVCTKCGAIYHLDNLKPKVKGICDNDGSALIQRDDDAYEKIKIRIDTFNKETKPIIKIYENKKLLFSIDSFDNINSIILNIKKIVGK